MASKSKKRRRVFRASCILAALIIAGSSFAWFTSKDEVTNRLSANADYGVSIVESFAPPKNWIPGEKVNKDVYATNTGSIAAYVREDVSGVLTLTKEKTVTPTWSNVAGKKGTVTLTNGKIVDDTENGASFADIVELTKEEAYYSIEAGSYLAYAPEASALKLGNQIVAYSPEETEAEVTYVYNTTTPAATYTITKAQYDAAFGTGGNPDTLGDTLKTTAASDWKEMKAAKSDFTPDVEGLYVFRRSIGVDKHAMEDFEYAGYYFKDGKYYKITDLKVQSDDTAADKDADPIDVSFLDRAGDDNYKDGQLSKATANFVKEVTEVKKQPDSFVYDEQNNRLVATYGTLDANAQTKYQQKALALDDAEHNLAEKRTALDRAIRDNDGANAASESWTNIAEQLTTELNAVNARLTKIGAVGTSGSLLDDLDKAKKEFTTADTRTGAPAPTAGRVQDAQNAASAAWSNLYKTSFTAGTSITGMDASKDQDTERYLAVTNTTYGKVNAPTGTPAAGSLQKALADAEKAVDDARASTAYGESMFVAYVNELKKLYPAKLSTTPTYDEVIRNLTYNDLTAASVALDAAAHSPELHNINELTYNLVAAQKEFDDEYTKLKNAIEDYKTNVVRLGKHLTNTTATAAADKTKETIAGQPIEYFGTTADAAATGVLGEIAKTEAEKSTLEAKKTALEAAIRTAMTNATSSLTLGTAGGQPATGTAENTLRTAIDNYQQASAAYDTALADFQKAEKDYKDNKQLKIYINLSKDAVTYGGVANKWQLLKSALDDFYSPSNATVPTTDGTVDTAVFYYTSILEPGETSSKLIDSVELDSAVTQDMYKYFDYDLNVALKSAQINYAEDNETILATATPKELNATAALSNNKDINTAITWSANP